MKTYRRNSETWYCDRRPLLKRIRQWIILIGGWEKANGEGWRLRSELNGIWLSPTPISLFGHRITIYRGLKWFEIRLPSGWLVCTLGLSEDNGVYISRDGTPSRAHHWIVNPPPDVLRAAQQYEDERQDRKSRWADFVRRHGFTRRQS